MGSSILLLERQPCGLCYNTHRPKCAIRSHHSLTRFDNIKQTLSKLHATQVDLKHRDRYGRRFPRGNDSANPYEALWGQCGPGSRGPVRGGKQYGPSNRGDGGQRNDAIIAEAHIDAAKSIVQPSNGDLRDKVCRLMAIAEPDLILPGPIVAGRER
jgi:hypothetical protein